MDDLEHVKLVEDPLCLFVFEKDASRRFRAQDSLDFLGPKTVPSRGMPSSLICSPLSEITEEPSWFRHCGVVLHVLSVGFERCVDIPVC